MKIINHSVANFFLVFLPEHEDVSLSQCANYLSNYYSEIEGKKFQNNNYFNQDERIEEMFPELPEKPLNLIKYKAYTHRKTDHKDNKHEDRIEELEKSVSKTIYSKFASAMWWVP